jgi:porin
MVFDNFNIGQEVIPGFSLTAYLITVFSLCANSVIAQKDTTESAFLYSANYNGDLGSNFVGGIESGNTFMGLIDFGVGYNFEKAGLRNGGELYIQVQSTHGRSLSSYYTGDLQVVSNIDYPDHTCLYLLAYSNTLGNLNTIIGLNDLNAAFHTSKYAGLFVNSTFGIMSSASLNMSVPIFPKTALGMEMHYNFQNQISLHGGLYDGAPGTLKNDRYNLNWSINKDEGLIFIGEIHYKTQNNRGIFKIGSMHHTAHYTTFISNESKLDNISFHAIADYMLVPKSDVNRGMGAFLQLGYTPESRINMNNIYLGVGINLFAPFKMGTQNVLGLAFGYAHLSKDYRNTHTELEPYEAVIELTYSVQINENIRVQPDIQYVINPMGSGAALNNAFVGLLRTNINLP